MYPLAFSYDRHMYFLGDEGGQTTTTTQKMDWINVIRDPIERAVSSFNYLRSKERWNELNIERPPQVIPRQEKLFWSLLLGKPETRYQTKTSSVQTWHC